MKTKNFTVAVLVAITLTIINGCATSQKVSLKSGEKEIYSSGHIGVFPGPDNSVSAATSHAIIQRGNAEAYRIKKQADAMASVLAGEGNNSNPIESKRGFLIALINNDPVIGAYIYHPELPGTKITIDPRGGLAFLDVRDFPENIIIYRNDGNIAKKIRPRDDYRFQEKVSHKKRIGNALADYKITLNKL